MYKEKCSLLEVETRRLREQLTEMDRTATEYSQMIQKKDEDLSILKDQLTSANLQLEKTTRQSASSLAQIATLKLTIEAHERDKDRTRTEKMNLQAEIDELRNLMVVKTNEASRQTEADKSREAELTNIRVQVEDLQKRLILEKQNALEDHNKLQVDFEAVVRDHKALENSNTSLSRLEHQCREKLIITEEKLSSSEKLQRSLESELQALRTNKIGLEGQLAETMKLKEVDTLGVSELVVVVLTS